MFQVYLTNFGTYANDGLKHFSFSFAVKEARNTGFECRIDRNGVPYAAVSPLRGLSYLETEDEMERARR